MTRSMPVPSDLLVPAPLDPVRRRRRADLLAAVTEARELRARIAPHRAHLDRSRDLLHRHLLRLA